jgi:anaerobic magnesium-protoporphyrin IX monomethyl ester cyclase
MKILLIAPMTNWGRRMPETPSRALLILGTLAQQRGHDVRIEHLDLIDYTGYGKVLEEYRPDVLAVTVNTFQVKSARLTIKQARVALPNIKIVIGGPHAGTYGNHWDNHPDEYDWDEKVTGEGEDAFLGILGEPPTILCIDDIPVPNYDLVNLNAFCGISPVGASPAAAIMASRGCPGSCTYCNTPIFWGKQVRYRNPQSVVDEVELLHRKYGVNEIFFQDDTFNLNHEWASEIFNDIIRRGLNGEMLFKIACRVNEKMITKDFLALACKAGVWNIFYGIESGSQEMLDRMKKHITIAEIKRAIKMTHEANIQTQCSYIVGLPGENRKTLAETGKLIKELNATRHGWSFFCPFPNTEATKEVIAKGHLKVTDYANYGYGSVCCRTDELSFTNLEAFQGFGV